MKTDYGVLLLTLLYLYIPISLLLNVFLQTFPHFGFHLSCTLMRQYFCPSLFILELISLHHTIVFIHIFENTVQSRLPRNLQFFPQARLIVFVTAYL